MRTDVVRGSQGVRLRVGHISGSFGSLSAESLEEGKKNKREEWRGWELGTEMNRERVRESQDH